MFGCNIFLYISINGVALKQPVTCDTITYIICNYYSSNINIFDQSIWECNGHFDHWFSNTKAFLCGIWNLRREKLYPSGSSDLVLHSSINRCVVSGRDAMAAHS